MSARAAVASSPAFSTRHRNTKADRRLLVHCYANSRASAFVFLWRVLKAGEDATAARADMVRLWDYNTGYEYRNVPQWQAFVEGALKAAP